MIFREQGGDLISSWAANGAKDLPKPGAYSPYQDIGRIHIFGVAAYQHTEYSEPHAPHSRWEESLVFEVETRNLSYSVLAVVYYSKPAPQIGI